MMKTIFFLPFNKGKGRAKLIEKAILKLKANYKLIISRRIFSKKISFQKFIFIDVEEYIDEQGNLYEDEKLIFLRYHQLDVVSKILNNIKERENSHKYLIQHSAGFR